MFRLLFTATGFLFFYSGGAVLGWVLLPLVRLVSWDRVKGRARCQRIVAQSFKFFMWWLSTFLYAVGFKTRDGQTLSGSSFDKPSVVIANHPTLLDIVLITSIIGHGTIVVHRRIYFNPLLGPLSWCCGFLWSDASAGRGAKVIQEAIQQVREGATLILFPEGSRSNPDGLLPFHRGAFRIAEQAGVPLVPLLVQARPRYLGRDQGFRGCPKKGRVSLHVMPFREGQREFAVDSARNVAKNWESRYRLALQTLEGDQDDTVGT